MRIRLGLRTRLVLGLTSLIGLLAFGWPLLISVTAADSLGQLGHSADAPWLFVVLLPLLLAIVLAQLSEGGIDAKVIALLGMLTAVGVALRALGPGAVGLEPGFFLLLVAGRAFGSGFGFVYGAVSMAVSGLLTGGVGPWLPYQMLAAGWVGCVAGMLPRATKWREAGLLCGYALVAGCAFGFLMNLWFWPFAVAGADLGFVPSDSLGANLHRYLLFYAATSLGWDIPRGVLSVVLIVLFAAPVLAALRRVGRVARFMPSDSAAGPGLSGRAPSRTAV